MQSPLVSRWGCVIVRREIGVWDASAGWRSSTPVGNRGPELVNQLGMWSRCSHAPTSRHFCPVTAEEWPVVERLAQLERHDLSQFRGYVPRVDGTYAFDTLDLFRTEPGRQAWLIRYGVTLAGFALTRPVESGGTSMYAFFIVRGLRRHGVGLQSARELLRLIPGVWGIAFQDENADAQPFWERVATDAVGDRWHLEKGTGPEGRPPDIWLRLDTCSAP